MKRRELYERVWQTPLSKLGPELGLSDVGLAKLCRRHAIPVPPVGYWAKVAAGQRPSRPRLPRPDDESTIHLPSAREVARRSTRQQHVQKLAKVGAEARRDVSTPVVEMRPSLEGCHPAVAKTAKFFAGIQPAIDKAEKAAAQSTARGEPNFAWFRLPRKAFGRYTPDADGTLRVAATLRNIDWILRFHDALLRALLASGCRVQARLERRSRWFEVQRDGEAIRLSFAEEFDKVVAGRSRASIGDWSRGGEEQNYSPRDSYKLKVERDIGGMKQWVSTAAELETRLPEIARDILGLLVAQGAQRKIVDAEREAQRQRDEQRAAERQAWFAAQQALAQRKAARKAQVDRAIAAAKALDEYAAVARLLSTLEHGTEPGSLDPGIRSWIELVRSELADPADTLITAIRKEAGGEERPLWWLMSQEVV